MPRILTLSSVTMLLFSLNNFVVADDVVSTEAALQHRMVEPDLPWQEVQDYTEARVLPMPEVTSVAQWEEYIEGRRQAVLQDVVLRGAAAGWRDAEKRVEWLETIDGGPGYKIRKLRYEAIPGLWIPALLYEPENLKGKVPVVLNVNGHDRNGKVADYKQMRCINQAKRGMLALNVEWLGMGQLNTPGFGHYKSNQIDLCGTSGVATHYLYMTRGLDILLEHPNADPARVAVAGLSGGGWQTIFVSSLDLRVTLSNPVAGYSSYLTRVRHTSDLGDSEQTPVDLAFTADYNHLTAMRAPRPTLLTFNAEDNCCFKAGHAKDPLLNAAQPIFNLYGKGSNLRAHVNTDPGSHNFEIDNRQQLYRMMGDHFFTGDSDYADDEIDSTDEIKSAEQLHVELPDDNLDFHQIAMQLMQELPHPQAQAIEVQRENLKGVLQYDEYQAECVQEVSLKVETGSATARRFRIDGAWSVPATDFTPEKQTGPTIILLADEGRQSVEPQLKALLEQGSRVIAIDPFYLGESKISQRDFLYGLLVSSVGKRPLGIQAAQVAAIGDWAKAATRKSVQVHAVGPRTGVISTAAAALHPDLFEQVKVENGFASLKQVIQDDMMVSQAPELFTFGLLAAFDLPQLKGLAQPTKFED